VHIFLCTKNYTIFFSFLVILLTKTVRRIELASSLSAWCLPIFGRLFSLNINSTTSVRRTFWLIILLLRAKKRLCSLKALSCTPFYPSFLFSLCVKEILTLPSECSFLFLSFPFLSTTLVLLVYMWSPYCH
jgi:hypothetical protein